MFIAEVTIAVLIGIIVIVGSIYFTYFSINKIKVIKNRLESGDYIDEPSKKGKVLSIILVIYFFASVATFSINCYYRYSPVIDHQYYVSIKTDSMSQALKSNVYLKNHNLTNQIAQYNIAIFDINKKDNIELYDIILFKYKKSMVAHRVVEVDENGNYITQGDKNPTRDDFVVKKEDVLGKYNHSLKFLSFVNYLGYTPGFYVSLIGVTYILGASLAFEVHKQKLLKTNQK